MRRNASKGVGPNLEEAIALVRAGKEFGAPSSAGGDGDRLRSGGAFPAPARGGGALRRGLNADHLGAGDFEAKEIPGDPTDPDSLAEGGNFRVMTDHGLIDVILWIPGLDEDDAFQQLTVEVLEGEVFGVPVQVCSLENLRTMKSAAGRPVDEADLEALSS